VTKEEEKLLKYSNLAVDFHHMYGMAVVTVPVVLGCTGVVSTRYLTYLKRLPEFTLKLFANL